MSVVGIALSLLVGVSLGFFGGGGSILTVPLLVYVFGLEPKTAIASSLVVVGVASASGAWRHWRAGNSEIRTALVFGAAGMAGAYVGGRASALIDGTVLLLAFAAMMALTSVAMWRGRRAPATPAHHTRRLAPMLAQGFAVGSATGLVGAGGGFLIVPALVLWARLPMRTAIGTSLLVIVMNTMAGYAGYASHVAIDVRLVAVISTVAIAGTFAGARLARRIDPDSLRRSFAAFVSAMALVILGREAGPSLATGITALPTAVLAIALGASLIGLAMAASRLVRPAPRPTGQGLFSDGAGI